MIKCGICNKEFTTSKGLSQHIRQAHNIDYQEYYDTYIGKHFCPRCKNETQFIGITKGYKEYCEDCIPVVKAERVSNTKKNWSPEKKADVKSKIKATMLKRYGVSSYLATEECQNHKYSKETRNKAKQTFRKTCLEKYGVETTLQLPEVRLKAKNTKLLRYGDASYTNHEQAQQTKLERYGDKNYTNSEKRKNTILTKYGVEHFTYILNNGLQSEIKQQNIRDFETENDCTEVFTLIKKFGQGWYRAKIVDLIYKGEQRAFVKNKDIPLIEQYYENRSSTGETEIKLFVKSVYSGTLIENSRKIIPPYELDIYIPDKKLAIEFNGSFWHSINRGISKDYHLMKTEMCKDIRLIHIFEYEWENKKEICKSIILSALGLLDRKIYARNCDVREVSRRDAKQFLEENHLQGHINSQYRLGLYYNNELVQLITVGKSRFKQNEYELLRMCSKLNTQVIGGFSKLMHNLPYNNVISYIDRSKYTGNGYYTTDWKIIGYTPPSYHYVKYSKIINRMSAQKHKLKLLLGDGFDVSKTEAQNMIDNKWLQIYDCGNIKVKYNKKSY